MYAIFGCASDFAHNFRPMMPTTFNCGATQNVEYWKRDGNPIDVHPAEWAKG